MMCSSVEELALGADRRISVVLVLEESSTNVLKGATGRKSEHLFLGSVETRGAAVVLDESKPLPNRVNWRLVLRISLGARLVFLAASSLYLLSNTASHWTPCHHHIRTTIFGFDAAVVLRGRKDSLNESFICT